MLIDFERVEAFIDVEGRTTLRASEFLREMVRQVNLNTVLSGTGSPEGVLEAEPKQMYMDESGSAGSILYIKQTGTGSTGWILV